MGQTKKISACLLALVLPVLALASRELLKKSQVNNQILHAFGPLTPRCVGRYVIELPKKFVLNKHGGQQIEEVGLTVTAATADEFASMLAERKAALEAILMVGEQKHPFLRKVVRLPAGTQGVIFDRAESEVGGGRLSRTLELLGWRDGYTITGTLKATDTTFPEDVGDKIVMQHLKTDVPQKLAKLVALFLRTKGRAEHEMPDQQGVCILNGFVSGPPTREENLTIFYHLETARDVYFRISTTSLYAETDTVLDRVKRLGPLLAEGGGKILRTARRDIHGMRANEIAYSILGDPDLEGRRIMINKYTLEANSKEGGASDPIITIDLLNGERNPGQDEDSNPASAPLTKATLSEPEASALWDFVVPTIRKNPSAFKDTGEPK